MPQWGADANTASKPSWGYLTNSRIANSANLVAKVQGWVLEHPWGDEVIVGIGQLANNAQLAVLRVDTISDVVNTTNQVLAARLYLNRGVTVANTPTILAIGANSSFANVTLSYSSADSEPERGLLVFKSANTDLSAYDVNTTLTINSTSTLTQTGNVAQKEITDITLPSTLPSLSAVFTVGEAS